MRILRCRALRRLDHSLQFSKWGRQVRRMAAGEETGLVLPTHGTPHTNKIRGTRIRETQWVQKREHGHDRRYRRPPARLLHGQVGGRPPGWVGEKTAAGLPRGEWELPPPPLPNRIPPSPPVLPDTAPRHCNRFGLVPKITVKIGIVLNIIMTSQSVSPVTLS